MAAKIQELAFKVGGEDAGLTQVLDNAGHKADSLAMKLKAINQEHRAEGLTALHRILSGNGERLAELALGSAIGGTAAIVANFVGESVAKLGEKIKEAGKNAAEGKGNFGDFAMGMAESLPILGGFVRGIAAAKEGLDSFLKTPADQFEKFKEEFSKLTEQDDKTRRGFTSVGQDKEEDAELERHKKRIEELDKVKKQIHDTPWKSNEARTKAINAYNDQVGDEDDTHEDRLKQIAGENDKRRAQNAEDSAREVANIKRNSHIAEMEQADKQAAELLKIDAKTEDEIHKIRRKAATDAKADPRIGDTIVDTAEEKVLDLIDAGEKQKATARAKFAQEAQDAARKHGQEMVKIEAETHIAQLKAAGKDDEAALAEIKEKTREKELGIVDAARKAGRGLDPAAAGKLADAADKEAGAEDRKGQTELAAEEHRQSVTHKEKALAIEQQLSTIKMQTLRDAAALGDKGVEQALKRQEIEEKTAQTLRELQKLREDKNSTFSERITAMMLMAQTVANEKRQLNQLNANSYVPEKAALEDAGSRTNFDQAWMPTRSAAPEREAKPMTPDQFQDAMTKAIIEGMKVIFPNAGESSGATTLDPVFGWSA